MIIGQENHRKKNYNNRNQYIGEKSNFSDTNQIAFKALTIDFGPIKYLMPISLRIYKKKLDGQTFRIIG